MATAPAHRLARLLLLLVAATGCTDAADPDMKSTGPGGKADDAYDDFLAGLYCEPDTGVCIVEGDIALTGDDDVRAYFEATHPGPNALTVFRENEVDKLWDSLERFDLTYCVSSTDFTPEEHQQVVADLAAAADDWERVAHVDFRHVPDEDARCALGTTRVRFPVISAPSDAPYIARAFFPHYEGLDTAIRMNFREMRELQGNHPEATLQGIMRHELGHTLGFRHEHIRSENTSQCDETPTFRPIAEYDRRSTMHYPYCDGERDWALQLTNLDAVGAAFFYPDHERYSGERCFNAELRSNGSVNAACTPVVREILDLANTAPIEVLDTVLDVRAADAIVARRGTSPFTTLASLDAVTYVGPVAVRRLYDYLYVNGRCEGEVDLDGLIDTRCRPIVHRLLELANTSTETMLDIDVGLDSRAAANIIETRPGNSFSSLVELRDVSHVKTTSLKRMYDYLY